MVRRSMLLQEREEWMDSNPLTLRLSKPVSGALYFPNKVCAGQRNQSRATKGVSSFHRDARPLLLLAASGGAKIPVTIFVPNNDIPH